jgi:high-affinity iron transporter
MQFFSPHIRALLFAGLILSYITASGAGENKEASRILVHTLNYISRDYPNGVADGKKSSIKMNMQKCSVSVLRPRNTHTQFAPDWPADSQKIGILIRRTDSLIHAKAPIADVAMMANMAKAEVIRASGLVIAPSKYPSLMNGKAVYIAQCAKCHGTNGLGDGKEGGKT